MTNRIPKLSDEELLSKLRKTKPVVFISENYAVEQDVPLTMDFIRGTSFVWAPKKRKWSLPRRLGSEPKAKITTYHTYGYYGFFKPSIAEVLAQIPEEYTWARYFKLIDGGQLTEDQEYQIGLIGLW